MATNAIQFIHNLKVRNQLLILAVVLLMPPAILMYLYVQEKQNQIDFSAKEIVGVEYSQPVRSLAQNAIEFRSLGTVIATGDQNTTKKLKDQAALIENAIRAIASMDVQYGQMLKTDKHWQTIQSRWNDVKVKASAGNNEQNNFVNAILAFIARVGDTSNLILDPDLDSFYLMDVVVVKLPSLIADIGTLQDFALRTATERMLQTEDRIDIINLFGKVRASLEATIRSLEVAFENNDSLKPKLAANLMTFSDSTRTLLTVIEEQLVRAEVIAVKGLDIYSAGSAVTSAGFSLYDNVASLLKDLLKTRVEGFTDARNTSVVSVLVSLALVLMLGYFMVSHLTLGFMQGAEIAQAIARGNLNNHIESKSRDEIGWLLHELKTTQKKLRHIVAKIKGVSNSVYVATSEISRGNSDLSQRTQEQASGLEEVASSMEEITSTVNQNAENAAQAKQLAIKAREQADAGGAVVNRAVQAMDQISDASKKISDIIGVIDEIAFQTNLLALNAAVEAARAGEQGRGFAVVANEVRNLAGRCKTAAKEIKGLIKDSVEKVSDGTKLVDESGAVLSEIVLAAKKVSDIVAEIAAASQEQSQGIAQVNKALLQMDEMTQQNASLVEQAAAVSEAVGARTAELNALVAYFKLPEQEEKQQTNVVQESAAKSGHMRSLTWMEPNIRSSSTGYLEVF